MLGEYRLRMELYAFDREAPMPYAHDLAILGGGGDLERFGHGTVLDGERMVAGHRERRGDHREHAAIVVHDGRELAVHHPLGTNDAAAERLPDRLVAQAHAEHRDLPGEA